MATLTVRNLDDAVKARLRVRAAENGRSVEAEVRAILEAAARPNPPERGLGTRIHALFQGIGGVEPDELGIPERAPSRPPPDFSE